MRAGQQRAHFASLSQGEWGPAGPDLQGNGVHVRSRPRMGVLGRRVRAPRRPDARHTAFPPLDHSSNSSNAWPRILVDKAPPDKTTSQTVMSQFEIREARPALAVLDVPAMISGNQVRAVMGPARGCPARGRDPDDAEDRLVSRGPCAACGRNLPCPGGHDRLRRSRGAGRPQAAKRTLTNSAPAFPAASSAAPRCAWRSTWRDGASASPVSSPRS
jgi:hypothetical protein